MPKLTPEQKEIIALQKTVEKLVKDVKFIHDAHLKLLETLAEHGVNVERAN